MSHIAQTDTSHSRSLQATEEVIYAYVKQEHSSRNSNLALLNFLAQSTGRDSSMSQRLLSACKQYFEQNCTKLMCYDDLRSYVEYLSDKNQEELRLQLAAHAKLNAPMADETEVSASKYRGNDC